MSHSISSIWVHAIWATKERQPLIHPEIEKKIHNYIRKQIEESDCSVKTINGMPDHVHVLFLLNPKRPLVDIIRNVKGNTSHWINQNNITSLKFSWQTGYAAYSVSESVKEKVFWYIKNQKKHHHSKTLEEEYEEFLRLKEKE